MPGGPGEEEMVVDNKKKTNKLDAQELEKRKAPFASPIVYTDGESTGSATTESTARHDRTEVDQTTEPGPLPKPPIMDRVR
jgi:hypothetical protein